MLTFSRKVQVLLFLAGTLMVLNGGRLAAAMVRYDDCGQICGELADCSTDCTSYNDEAFDTTCGEYDGGADEGWCVGTCGDGYCNHLSGEDDPGGDNYCDVDCGYCGDGVCSYWEVDSCEADCPGTCPDGQCQPWEANPCSPSYCALDCPGATCEETVSFQCQPTTSCNQGGDPSGHCNILGHCIEDGECGENGCNTDANCCANETCQLDGDPQVPEACLEYGFSSPQCYQAPYLTNLSSHCVGVMDSPKTKR